MEEDMLFPPSGAKGYRDRPPRIFQGVVNMTADIIQNRKKGLKRFLALCKRDSVLLMIIALPFAYYVVYKYLPMYGVIMAFEKFSVKYGIIGSPWVGLKWFKQFF